LQVIQIFPDSDMKDGDEQTQADKPVFQVAPLIHVQVEDF